MLISVCPMCEIHSINCLLAVFISIQFSIKRHFGQMSTRSCVCRQFGFRSFVFRHFVCSADCLSAICPFDQMSFGQMSFQSPFFRLYVLSVICFSAICPTTIHCTVRFLSFSVSEKGTTVFSYDVENLIVLISFQSL